MRTSTRVAALIVKGKKLLLVKGKGFDIFWTPGGRINKGESEEECLRRELREETGANLLSAKFFGEYSRMSPFHRRITRNRVYTVKIEGDIVPGNEIESFVWLSRAEFQSGKYNLIPLEKEEIIPALIKKGLF
ncbi:MAG: NUDIX domain-containing protein [archaeon]